MRVFYILALAACVDEPRTTASPLDSPSPLRVASAPATPVPASPRDAMAIDYAPSTALVAGAACAFTQGAWGQGCSGENLGCTRDAWWDVVYPSGATIGARSKAAHATAASVEATLPLTGPPRLGTSSTFFGQLTALTLNLAYSDAGVFGAGSDLGGATLTEGTYAGWTARDLVAYAGGIDPTAATSELISALAAFNEGFHSCDPAEFASPDEDDDGVLVDADCDDGDPRVGALLYASDFSADDGALTPSPTLAATWRVGDGVAANTTSGQQALLGGTAWTDTVTRVTVSADGAQSGCVLCGETERFRAGVLARASLDGDQREGFHGYRCAVAVNEDDDCGAAGPFVQLAAFLDAEEDGSVIECGEGTCYDPTFDSLDRQERGAGTDVLRGGEATLDFWAVGDTLVCDFTGEDGERVTARATDARFDSGAAGLSVLNAMASFDEIRVCEALAAP
jgi:hypothetical protein